MGTVAKNWWGTVAKKAICSGVFSYLNFRVGENLWYKMVKGRVGADMGKNGRKVIMGLVYMLHVGKM